MALRTMLAGLALASFATVLSGCAGTLGVDKATTTVSFSLVEGKATWVGHNQWGPGFLTGLDSDSWYISYIVKGNGPTPNQIRDVAETERGCRIVGKTGQPNPLTTILANGALYATSGVLYGPAVGAVDKAFRGVEHHNSAALGTSSGLGGLANGTILVGGRQYGFQSCARTVLQEVFPESEIFVPQTFPY